MAVLAIIFLLDQPKLSNEAHCQVGETGLLCELRIIYAEGLAFRAANRVAHRSVLRIPLAEKSRGSLPGLGGDFEAYAGHCLRREPKSCQPHFVTTFGRDARLNQPVSDCLRVASIVKYCDT